MGLVDCVNIRERLVYPLGGVVSDEGVSYLHNMNKLSLLGANEM